MADRAIERRRIADQRLERREAASASGSVNESDMTADRDRAADFAAFTYHGGALDVARRLAPGAPEPWIDLSTGVNPHPYPLPDLAPEVWSRLPAAEALAELEARRRQPLRRAVGSRGRGPRLAGAHPGAGAHCSARRGRRAGADLRRLHEAAFAAAGAHVDEAKRSRTLAGCDVAIVVNPNNPDGRIAPRADLLALARAAQAPRRARSIVDEAFADFDGASESLAPVLPARARSCCARSASPLASRACGSALRSLRPELGERLRAALGHWPVSGPAIAIGTQALADRAWTDAMRGTARQGCGAPRRAPEGGGLSHRRWDAPIPPRREKRRARRIRAAARGGHSRPGPSQPPRIGCGSGFQAMKAPGGGSPRRSQGASQKAVDHGTTRLAFGRACRLTRRRMPVRQSRASSRFPPARRSCRR